MKPIEVGSITILKSARQSAHGPDMTVVAIGEADGDKGAKVQVARCFWFDKDYKLQEGLFPIAALLVS